MYRLQLETLFVFVAFSIPYELHGKDSHRRYALRAPRGCSMEVEDDSGRQHGVEDAKIPIMIDKKAALEPAV